jgi:hypothetical protein
MSKSLVETEKNYLIIKLECLAVFGEYNISINF